MTELKVICSWCGEEIEIKDGDGETGESHGICDSCLVKNFPDLAQKILGDKEVIIKGGEANVLS